MQSKLTVPKFASFLLEEHSKLANSNVMNSFCADN